MSWRDSHGNRRGDDEDWDSVQADLKRGTQGEPFVYCSKCSLPISARLGLTQHKECPETTSNQDGR